MNNPTFPTEALVLYLIFLVIGVLVFMALIRWSLKIKTQIRYQKAIIKLLALNAEKNGASEGLIKEIVFEADEEFKNDEHFKADEKTD